MWCVIVVFTIQGRETRKKGRYKEKRKKQKQCLEKKRLGYGHSQGANHVRTQWEKAAKEKRFQNTLTLLACWSQTFSLQNYKELYLCCSSRSVCDICSDSPGTGVMDTFTILIVVPVSQVCTYVKLYSFTYKAIQSVKKKKRRKLGDIDDDAIKNMYLR